MALSISSLVKARFIISGTSPGATGPGLEGVAAGLEGGVIRAPVCGDGVVVAGAGEPDPRSTPFRQATITNESVGKSAIVATILIRFFKFIARKQLHFVKLGRGKPLCTPIIRMSGSMKDTREPLRPAQCQ